MVADKDLCQKKECHSKCLKHLATKLGEKRLLRRERLLSQETIKTGEATKEGEATKPGIQRSIRMLGWWVL